MKRKTHRQERERKKERKRERDKRKEIGRRNVCRICHEILMIHCWRNVANDQNPLCTLLHQNPIYFRTYLKIIIFCQWTICTWIMLGNFLAQFPMGWFCYNCLFKCLSLHMLQSMMMANNVKNKSSCKKPKSIILSQVFIWIA